MGKYEFGTNQNNKSEDQPAKSVPAAPPSRASTRLSVNNCRTRRTWLAPIARRIAISFSRLVARASSKFAMFAATISNTAAVTAMRIRKTGRSRL